jgi:hypothetical protein
MAPLIVDVDGGMREMTDGTTGGPAAGKRRGSRQVAAREQARLRAAQFTAMETRRQEIAARYLLAQEDIADQAAAAERRVAAERVKLERRLEELRASLEEPLARLRRGTDALAVELLATGVSQQEAAGRLGVTAAEIGRVKRESDRERANAGAAQEAAPAAGQVPQQGGQEEATVAVAWVNASGV